MSHELWAMGHEPCLRRRGSVGVDRVTEQLTAHSPMTEITDRLQSALEGRYTIEREIGAGGMVALGWVQDVIRQAEEQLLDD